MHPSHAYHIGLAAERTVARHYQRTGHEWLEHRWRSERGEIDLIMHKEEIGFLFIEVKQSKTWDTATAHFYGKQFQRIQNAALDYLAHHSKPINTLMRFDLAVVNRLGAVHIIDNIMPF